jgi:hypothetical protein
MVMFIMMIIVFTLITLLMLAYDVIVHRCKPNIQA